MKLDEAKHILKKNGYICEGEGMSKPTINKRIIADIRLQLIKRGWSFMMADDYLSNNSKRLSLLILFLVLCFYLCITFIMWATNNRANIKVIY